MLRAVRGGGGDREREGEEEEGRLITADADDGTTTAGCRRDREPEEMDVVGNGEGCGGLVLVEPVVVGRDGPGGGGEGGCVPVIGGRRARLLARMGVGRRSDGLRVIALALALAPAAVSRR